MSTWLAVTKHATRDRSCGVACASVHHRAPVSSDSQGRRVVRSAHSLSVRGLGRRGSRWRSPPPVGHAVGLSAPRRPVAPQVGLRVFGRRTAAAPRAPSRLRRVRAPWPKLHYCTVPDALLYHVRSIRSSALRRDECTTARTPTAYICSHVTSTLSPLVGTR